MVSLLDVQAYAEAERLSSSTTEWIVTIERDASGRPVSMGWTPPWWGGKAPPLPSDYRERLKART